MARVKLVVIGLCLIFGLVSPERIRYDNYRIYQVLPRTYKHLQSLTKLETSSDSIKFLTPVTLVDNRVNILVAPHKTADFVAFLDQHEIFFELVEENFQRILDAEQEDFKKRANTYDWTGYHTLNETYEWMRWMQSRFPSKMEMIVGGKTYEGREILGVKISFKSGNKGIFIEGGIHAREWITPATVTYIINEIILSTNEEIRTMAESYDWYIFPHVNPDGFVYTHTTDRLWRKTRSPGTTCYGADANRNWDVKWMTIGASSQECSETYAGKSAFSEIEMKSLADYIASLKGKLHAYLSIHSFGQLLMWPYGYTADPAPHDADLRQIAEAATTALSKRFGTQYSIGSIYLAIYPTSGSSIEWAYDAQNISVAFTYELRPKSSVNGFVLPSAQIIPTALETMDSLIALTKEAASLGYL
ncbi:unnamed protein product [Hermetia illucens]|uniref:Zinc carboxypeptidase A 1 n=1 Tax=Hermetia illucens TaxID=343691 RepID=A0A7R8USS9_HERIL|nr:zinc carboxypeptidase-like [Hermetia illucens]CAD7086388.1 unnamed protein product [Hermetia illucens]